MAIGDSIRQAESGGDPNAKNPNSSASGPDQFLDSTWLDTIKAARPDLAQGQSDQSLLALKTDPKISGEMRDYYAQQNQAVLARNGLPVTPGNTYLAHFAGPGGAVGLLNADPSTPAGSILGPAVVRSNPFLAHMTAGDVAAWASRRVGGAAPAPMSLAGPQATPQSAPAPAAPVPAPAQNNAPVNSAAAPSVDLSALTAVPKLANILGPRPNPFGVRLAPLSLGG